MQREIRYTADGSVTILVPESGITFHSMNGAITESMYVFIEAGLKYWFQQNKSINQCRIFEMGFGTGLNALLTAQEALQSGQSIYYETVELYPLEDELVADLNYCDQFEQPLCTILLGAMHACPWEIETGIGDFSIKKVKASLSDYQTDQKFDIIYFDAFDPNVQPELWEESIFHKLYNTLVTGGILVTYSSKGAVRRAMQSAGFIVEKLPGPPGKREIVRATK